ncbi:NADH-quinone oxidoreductase subunit L [Candidatus Deianiraea vastatrix]|uniref:NADH-quinone oxidoreductase subunit L n=1 Tax=Candidatus Deianiraea vastatrix TaxID=2163644 RepID=A0A5B8XF00_9RICK|nr:NADH-quinone oxidoreductase subunit L [Candidatus Deianiraea vastatrix]QED23853.1 NADH-quinone oxidoreductase subunit L [Candidatus Deianiraea vastatrix]
MIGLSLLILPAISSVLCLLINKIECKKSTQIIAFLSSTLIGISAIISLYIAYRIFFAREVFEYYHAFDWILLGKSYVSFGASITKISSLMVTLITFVSCLVHIYSTKYMHEEKYERFMINISFFTFCMICLVLSSNFLQLFFGWEGVGVASYLLINYYHRKNSANLASMKAFLTNRVADVFMIFGISMLLRDFGSLNFAQILSLENITQNTYQIGIFTNIDVICMTLFMGAMGKSAQIFLHIWLPDAMEGPTPVSALIHAATMVTAGVFMLCKCAVLFDNSPLTMNFITIIGSITAIFAASVAILQTDIKKIIAYSTCSQLGYMFMACGLGLYSGGFFHLLTHGFFKALLFLCAGSVILGMHHEQNIFHMGRDLYKKMPITCFAMIIGTLAICGIPPFAGFYSKDAILHAAATRGDFIASFAYICGNIVVFMTSFYSFRLIYVVFFGQKDAHHEAHESNIQILAPLFILAILSVISGHFLENVLHILRSDIIISENNAKIAELMEKNHESHLPLVISLFAISLASFLYLYKTDIPARIYSFLGKFTKFFENKWYFDELYSEIFVKPYIKIADYMGLKFDLMVNKVIVSNQADCVLNISNKTKRIQSGCINYYLIISVVTVIFMILLTL